MTQILIKTSTDEFLWCDVCGHTETGAIKFFVISGGWEGHILGNVVHVNATNECHIGHIVWSGKAPFGSGDYNRAIEWILQQNLLPQGRQRDYLFCGPGVAINPVDSSDEYDGVPF